MGVTIGIDLGTTNSCAAIVKDGKPKVISDTGGGFTIPSMVAVDEKGNRLVGQSAKRQSLINPLNTIYGAKRLIGRRYDSKVTGEAKKHFLYDMAQGDNENVLIKMASEVYGLDEVSALILDKVRNTAQDILQEEVTSAVVTVPAYFSDRQRQAVKDAGKIAEMEVLRIINEPTAAALAYGWGKHLQERVAVYDLGGGTFDISLLEVRDSVYEVKATGGDTFLGGVDFDNRLFEYVLGEFNKQHQVDLSNDRLALQRVKDACERGKIDLSIKLETRVHIPFISMGENGPITLDVTVTRDQFKSIITDLVDKTLEACTRVLKDANWTVNDIQEVLLVGGQTRSPYVQERVGAFFGKPPSKGVHPDEAVAIGAAIMAHSLSDEADYKITLIDVLPMGIGVALSKDKFHAIFPRNTSIPNATSMVFTTSKDNQTQLKLKICQGDSEKASENELLGEFVFSGIAPAPKGQAHLEVILKLSPEGMLTVEAQDPDTKKWIETTITVTSGLTQKTHQTKLIEHRAPPPKQEKVEEKPPEKRVGKIYDKTPAPNKISVTVERTAGSVKSPPKPPPAKPAPKPPPARPGTVKTPAPIPTQAKPATPPTPAPTKSNPFNPETLKAEKTPPPLYKPPEKPSSWTVSDVQGMGVQTKVSQTGKVLLKRDPITGQIIKETAEGEEGNVAAPDQQAQQPKPEFKKYSRPPQPPSIGEKIGGFFKNLFGKKDK